MSTTSTYSWSQAQAYCRSLSADLVKINSAEENEFVLSLVRKLAPSLKQIWIGLKWNTNGFYWIDLSVPVYKSWAPQHPNGNANEPCVQMWINNGQHLPKYASGYWNDIDCHYRSDFPNGIVWLTGWLADWLTGWLAAWLIYLLTDLTWLVDFSTKMIWWRQDCITYRHWSTEWRAQLTHWLNDWLNDCLIEKSSD